MLCKEFIVSHLSPVKRVRSQRPALPKPRIASSPSSMRPTSNGRNAFCACCGHIPCIGYPLLVGFKGNEDKPSEGLFLQHSCLARRTFAYACPIACLKPNLALAIAQTRKHTRTHWLITSLHHSCSARAGCLHGFDTVFLVL